MISIPIGMISFLFSSVVAPVGRSTTGVMIGTRKPVGSSKFTIPICDDSNASSINGASPQFIYANFIFKDIELFKDGFLDVCRNTLNNQIEYVGSIGSSGTSIAVITNEKDRWAFRFKETRDNGNYCDGEDLVSLQVLTFKSGIEASSFDKPVDVSMGDLMDLCALARLRTYDPVIVDSGTVTDTDKPVDPVTVDSGTYNPPANPQGKKQKKAKAPKKG